MTWKCDETLREVFPTLSATVMSESVVHTVLPRCGRRKFILLASYWVCFEFVYMQIYVCISAHILLTSTAQF